MCHGTCRILASERRWEVWCWPVSWLKLMGTSRSCFFSVWFGHAWVHLRHGSNFVGHLSKENCKLWTMQHMRHPCHRKCNDAKGYAPTRGDRLKVLCKQPTNWWLWRPMRSLIGVVSTSMMELRCSIISLSLDDGIDLLRHTCHLYSIQ